VKMENEETEQKTPPRKSVSNGEIPETVPVLPLRSMVMFPGMVIPASIGRPSSVRLIEETVVSHRYVGVFAQRSPEVEEPKPEDLYSMGVVCRIVKFLRSPDPNDSPHTAILQGIRRMQIADWTQLDPYLVGTVALPEEVKEESKEIDALMVNLRRLALRLIELTPNIPQEVGVLIQNIEDPSQLLDLVTGGINAQVEQKQDILETLKLRKRFDKVNKLLTEQLELLELGNRIQSQVKDTIDKNQREYYLRQQLKAIQQELGEGDEQAEQLAEIRKKIEEARLPEEAQKEADRQLQRLRGMPQAAAEYGVIRTYLEWLSDLPWAKSTEDKLDVGTARKILDEDHFDLEQVKERILEFLAVRKLKGDTKGPILCFVGPPGVGKTSLGRSIARAMGREFLRMSLGGIRDEAEIRGHRRTYVGALPGRIIQGLRRVGTNNPVFMLDEIDKVGSDFRGDPSSALLEVLDPEQNDTFSDNYLEVTFDLSKVLFITTGNVLETIPPPLKDRMEVIEIPGYTEEEKVKIADRYLLPRQLKENGLTEEQVRLSDETVKEIIGRYTKEAGLRNLERRIGSLCRKVARRVAEGETVEAEISVDQLDDLLGPRKFFAEAAERTQVPGVATGLAWTPSGGEILFVEATKMPGKGELILTGQLGDVMKESAQAALSYVRSQAESLQIHNEEFQKDDIHVHVPAGAIPKDGPSAGLALLAALVSLLSDRCVKGDVAMTGEITLRGLVLPVGGIKEKVLAAKRAGIKEIILPDKNEGDLRDVPEELRGKLTFHFISRIDEAMGRVFSS